MPSYPQPLRVPRSTENAWNGVMDGGRFMNMLPKDHIHVVQRYITYICLVKFNHIYMLLISMYILLNLYVV